MTSSIMLRNERPPVLDARSFISRNHSTLPAPPATNERLLLAVPSPIGQKAVTEKYHKRPVRIAGHSSDSVVAQFLNALFSNRRRSVYKIGPKVVDIDLSIDGFGGELQSACKGAHAEGSRYRDGRELSGRRSASPPKLFDAFGTQYVLVEVKCVLLVVDRLNLIVDHAADEYLGLQVGLLASV